MKLEDCILFKEVPYEVWSTVRWVALGVAILSIIADIVVRIIVKGKKRK